MKTYSQGLLNVSIVVAILSIIVAFIYMFSRSLATLSIFVGLAGITLILGIFQVISNTRDIKLEKEHSMKVTLQLNGGPITVETSDTEQVEKILKLAQNLHIYQSVDIDAGTKISQSTVRTPLASECSLGDRALQEVEADEK